VPTPEPAPAQLVSAATHTLPLLSKLPAVMTRLLPVGHREPPLAEVPYSPFNQHTDGRRNFAARSYDLPAVLDVRKLLAGATFNDVVLTGIGGAMRRYLLEKGELPEAPLVTAMAIALPSGPGQRGANHVSVVRVSLGTKVADPIARLAAVHESATKSKAVSDEVGERVLEYVEFVPGGLLVATLRLGMAANLERFDESSRVANTLVSTMRGPDFPIYLVGARMIAGYALSPFTQGCGLIHNVISYQGSVVVSINGCPTVLPDIEHYADCMNASFAELTSVARTVP
jgi:diacylglycerol O-acyltransferase / wax synthase